MQATTGGFGLIKRGLKHRFFFKRTGLNGAVDAEQILVDDPAGADVHVPHFAVAHLPLRQADVRAIRAKGGMRRLRIELIHICRLGHGNGVVAIGIAEAPTVQYDECGFHAAKVALGSTPLGPNHTHHESRRIEGFHVQ